MADKKQKLIDSTVPRFLLVGIINTLVGCGAMFLLYNLAHWSYWLSSAANYVLGGIVSFFLNKYFTFRRREWSWGQVARFALNVAVCYVAGYGLARLIMGALEPLGLLPPVWWERLSKLVGMGLYTCLNYFGQRFFAFREGKRREK